MKGHFFLILVLAVVLLNTTDIKFTYAETASVVNNVFLEDAVEYQGHHYKFYNMDMKWAAANEFCRSLGGHLATAETKDENEFIKKYFLDVTDNTQITWAWIGGVRDKNDIWHWVTGKSLTSYFDWTSGKPREVLQLGGDYMCLWSNYGGKWDNHGKRVKHPFICEWESADDAHDIK